MPEYNSVKLVVENSESIVTIDIPVTMDIKFEHEAVQVLELFDPDRKFRFQPDMMDLTFHMRAFFDPKKGYVFRQETLTKNPTVNQRIADGDI